LRPQECVQPGRIAVPARASWVASATSVATPMPATGKATPAEASAAAITAPTKDVRIVDLIVDLLAGTLGSAGSYPRTGRISAADPAIPPSSRPVSGWNVNPASKRPSKEPPMSKVRTLEPRGKNDALDTPTDLSDEAVRDISKAMNGILADSFALYFKTKNFHWHVSGPHFRDYHLLLDEQGEQIFDTTDEIAERVRKIGGTTLRSIGQVAKLQSLKDNDEEFVPPLEMLRELMNDNKAVAKAMRAAHEVADKHDDVATASLLETFIDAAERRTWFLFEASRRADQTGH
jgi:starvation-inducible DNA-binding protein